MSQRTLVIRCDASLLIGSGHVMRCRSLAHELLRRGAKVVFLCRRQPGDLIKLLAQEFTVLELPELMQPRISQPYDEPLQSRQLYSNWLGCGQKQDALDCLKALAQAGIRNFSWLVIDHYGLDADWEAEMLSAFVADVDGFGLGLTELLQLYFLNPLCPTVRLATSRHTTHVDDATP